MADGPQVGLQTYTMTEEETRIAPTIWPCLKCGRHEFEECNGFNGCPHGRSRRRRLHDYYIETYGPERGAAMFDNVTKMRPGFVAQDTEHPRA